MTETLRILYNQIWDALMNFTNTVSYTDVIDILLVAFLIYCILSIMQRTSASNVIRGLVLLLVVAGLADFFSMSILSYLLQQVLHMGIILIVVLFQPEIRKLFERVSVNSIDSIFKKRSRFDSLEATLNTIQTACYSMSKSNIGALIVLERMVGLNDFAGTGVNIDAEVSPELIQSIFYENTPLHDGALIIRNNRVLAAACVLPLTTNYNIAKDLGMRHKAAVGLSERSDAVIVIVSEQTGNISVASNGMLKRNLDNETFEKLLKNEVISGYDRKAKKSRKLKELSHG